MRKTLLILLALACLFSTVHSQSDIKMTSEYGSENDDLMSVLRFEEINLEKLTFKGKDLKGKDYLISIKQITNGKIIKNEVVFNSKEDAYFKIKSENFAFRLLTKITHKQTAKFDFQFNGFSKQTEFKVAPNQTEFALKTFLGGEKDMTISLNKSTYILTYMMPYLKKDGSKQYCEVAQSGINPEDFGKIYKIPTYFLIDIKFQ
jgi:hypothetical protein